MLCLYVQVDGDEDPPCDEPALDDHDPTVDCDAVAIDEDLFDVGDTPGAAIASVVPTGAYWAKHMGLIIVLAVGCGKPC
jgi:hypothetical protein